MSNKTSPMSPVPAATASLASNNQTLSILVQEADEKQMREVKENTEAMDVSAQNGGPDNMKKPMVAKKKRIIEKLVYVVSIATLVVLGLSLMNIHWFVPYYYAISTPVLLSIRLVLYWKSNWQYFLIDFCYFSNMYCYIFLWAIPWQREASVVLFAFANGPLAWATFMFRNSMVFHDTDRMTSCYIHTLPMFLSFGLRWFPADMSHYWYQPFNSVYSEDVAYMFIWIVAVPFGAFVFHTCLYMLIVNIICKPDEKYLNSFRYLSSKRNVWYGKVIHMCGDKYSLLVFTLFNWVYCLLSLLMTVLLYKYLIAHIISMCCMLLVITWNAASFYIDVFAVKGFGEES